MAMTRFLRLLSTRARFRVFTIVIAGLTFAIAGITFITIGLASYLGPLPLRLQIVAYAAYTCWYLFSVWRQMRRLGSSLQPSDPVLVDEADQVPEYKITGTHPGRVDIGTKYYSGTTPIDRDVQFTAYRPESVQPLKWYSLPVFIHKGTDYVDLEGNKVDPIKEVRTKAHGLLGAQTSTYGDVRSDSRAALHRGQSLRLRPWIQMGEFDLESAGLSWQRSVKHVEFRFKVSKEAEGGNVAGGVQVFDGILLIGEINFVVFVGQDAPDPGGPAVATIAAMYRKIFASYAHDDWSVVQSLMSSVRSTGDQYLIDVQDLRAGKIWSEQLEEFIDQADIFQLFWSNNSMRSDFVRREWEYALGLGRTDFVRPTYWEQPMPEDSELGLPPSELRVLHFAQVINYYSEGIGDRHRRRASESTDGRPSRYAAQIGRRHPRPPARRDPLLNYVGFALQMVLAGAAFLGLIFAILIAVHLIYP